ncbi:unnamed protein product [Hymenolepis diminuta]|uniref:Sodium-and chloride-dependent GABA transporter 2 n=1 Tax=Hymenolepis diminuta TaxID=6216 RepID=A0A0R3SLV3_HYMDI|nr:unnamed protein product [Hymenolepis diminuta]
MVVVSWIMSLYYNVIVAQALLYLFYSFTRELPWTYCNNTWNDPLTCLDQTRNLTELFASK